MAAGIWRSPGGASAAVALLVLIASAAGPHTARLEDEEYRNARERMVRDQIEARGIRDARVLEAMRRVPRHLFVPETLRARAYEDYPLPIGHDQSISQPYIVAFMSEAVAVGPGHRVLEIGTGSGYQAALLAEMGVDVYTIEIVEPLARAAARTLASLGYSKVHARVGDGYGGWPEHAPYDAIIVTAAPEHVPRPLVEQLAVNARLVIPVGGRVVQQMTVITRRAAGATSEEVMPVRFVPLGTAVNAGRPASPEPHARQPAAGSPGAWSLEPDAAPA